MAVVGSAKLVYLNEDLPNSQGSNKTFCKDYFDDDGIEIADFERILQKSDSFENHETEEDTSRLMSVLE